MCNHGRLTTDSGRVCASEKEMGSIRGRVDIWSERAYAQESGEGDGRSAVRVGGSGVLNDLSVEMDVDLPRCGLHLVQVRRNYR